MRSWSATFGSKDEVHEVEIPVRDIWVYKELSEILGRDILVYEKEMISHFVQVSLPWYSFIVLFTNA